MCTLFPCPHHHYVHTHTPPQVSGLRLLLEEAYKHKAPAGGIQPGQQQPWPAGHGNQEDQQQQQQQKGGGQPGLEQLQQQAGGDTQTGIVPLQQAGRDAQASADEDDDMDRRVGGFLAQLRQRQLASGLGAVHELGKPGVWGDDGSIRRAGGAVGGGSA